MKKQSLFTVLVLLFVNTHGQIDFKSRFQSLKKECCESDYTPSRLQCCRNGVGSGARQHLVRHGVHTRAPARPLARPGRRPDAQAAAPSAAPARRSRRSSARSRWRCRPSPWRSRTRSRPSPRAVRAMTVARRRRRRSEVCVLRSV